MKQPAKTTLMALDIPYPVLCAAEKEAEKSGRRTYQILSEWTVLGHREAKVKTDHIKARKVKV